MTEFETPMEPSLSPRIEIGKQLKQAREALGFSCDHVSSIIRIRPLLLKALEDGDYKQFSSVVYIKGFIKIYAEFLKIPFEPLLDLYQKEPHEKKATQVYDLIDAAQGQKGPGGKLVFATTLCVALIIFLSFDWQRVSVHVPESYKLPEELTQETVKVETSQNLAQLENKISTIASVSPQTPQIIEPFGEEHLFLIGIPRTNNPVLKPEKITLVPEKEGWIELYNGEVLLLRTQLKANQNYLIPTSEITTLLIKDGDWAKIYALNKDMKMEKSSQCNDYYCDLNE